MSFPRHCLASLILMLLLIGAAGCGQAPEKNEDPAAVERQRQEYKATTQREIEDIESAEQ